MSDIKIIAQWIEAKITEIIAIWLRDPLIKEIFSQYHIDIKKFQDKFSKALILQNIAVMQGTKSPDDCPIMNKFVDLMLEKEICSKDIHIICTGLRTAIFNTLFENYEGFCQETEAIETLNSVFDRNLAGVLSKFDTKNRTRELQKYFKKLQIVFDMQENIIFQLQDNKLFMSNKTLFTTAGVTDKEHFDAKYVHPLDFIMQVMFKNTLFQSKEHANWINDLLTENAGECEAEVFNHVHNQSSLMYMKVVRIEDEERSFIFSIIESTKEQNEIKRLTELVNRDPLTQLLNRHKFEEYLQEKIQSCEEKTCRMLTVHIRGFKVANEIYGVMNGDDIIKSVSEVIKRNYAAEEAARIDTDRFSIISETMDIKRAEQIVEDIRKILENKVHAKDIIINSSLITLRKKESVHNIFERSDELLREAKLHNDYAVYDEDIIAKRLEHKKRTQTEFLKSMIHYLAEERTLPVTSLYMELPIHSDAKILQVSGDYMRLKLRKIAIHSLDVNDYIYIQMPLKPNFQARVKEIDIHTATIILSDFEPSKDSPLDRENIYVKLQEKLDIHVVSPQKNLFGSLESLSINSFVIILDHLHDISIGTDIDMRVKLEKEEIIYQGKVAKIMSLVNKFKIIVHLYINERTEEELTSFISKRQREIIRQLRNNAK